MNCVCGHFRGRHVNTGWPRYASYCDTFTCCDRTPNRSPGKGGGEHDFINHPITRCTCVGFTPQEDTP